MSKAFGSAELCCNQMAFLGNNNTWPKCFFCVIARVGVAGMGEDREAGTAHDVNSQSHAQNYGRSGGRVPASCLVLLA